MENARRVPMGVAKQNKRTNKRLLKNLKSYLTSDCYMFAPLFFSSHSRFLSTAVSGFENTEINKGKKKRMLEKVEEYLKSDYHLYGSMISSPKLSPPLKDNIDTEQVVLAKRVTREVSTSTTVIVEDARRTLGSSNIKWDGQYPEKSTFHQPLTAEKDKTLRRSLRRRSQSSSSAEGEKLNPSKRKIAIE